MVTALSILGAGGAYGYVQWRLDQIRRVGVGGLQPQGSSSQSRRDGSSIAPFTLLAIGSDTRDLAPGSASQFGSASSVGGSRSDSIILIRVVPKTRSLALLSIPRDTLVPIPGYGTTRINTAFNSGNPTLLVNVLQQDFGIQVNHVVEFNFDTFEQVADAVGGVEQWFPAPAKDAFSLLNVPAGCVNLTGAQALGFVRSREFQYYLNGEWHFQFYPESDLARIQRQQAFARDLVRKAKTKFGPTSVIQLNDLIGSITRNLTVDKAFSNSLLLSLAQDYRSANLSTIPSYTFPAVNSTSNPGALDPQMAPGRAIVQEWLDVGQPAPPKAPPSSSATSSPPTTVVAPSSIAVQVVNGSGVGGQAGTAGQDLTSAGYHVTVSGDAPNFGLATTEIEYAPDSLTAARQLQSQLVGPSTLVEDRALTPTPYNLELITGLSFAGVKGMGSGPSSSGPAPTTTTTVAGPAYAGTQTVDPESSSVYDGVYIPPGLTPGQTPQTCGE
ncbi:MAG TPA: LCP family protein [Acidimicrobiales bacterium]|nr:LCP family protein [Acidimicrobiales bacterium]